jgi:TonB family protein
MFSQTQPDSGLRGRLPQIASLLAHGGLLLWLLWPSQPMVLMPRELKAGIRDGAVTDIYFPDRGSQAMASSEAAKPERMSKSALLNWRPPHVTKHRQHGLSVADGETQTADATATTNSLPPVGSPFGNRLNGFYDGPDVSPALPVASHEPKVDPDDLTGIPEGDVVVEITIDTQGNIVAKRILRSLTPTLDLKVMAALEGWHFQPATRNGMAISSKQDVYYHFRPN